jgi:hypothetical protein
MSARPRSAIDCSMSLKDEVLTGGYVSRGIA